MTRAGVQEVVTMKGEVPLHVTQVRKDGGNAQTDASAAQKGAQS
jgi:hypothetical protein